MMVWWPLSSRFCTNDQGDACQLTGKNPGFHDLRYELRQGDISIALPERRRPRQFSGLASSFSHTTSSLHPALRCAVRDVVCLNLDLTHPRICSLSQADECARAGVLRGVRTEEMLTNLVAFEPSSRSLPDWANKQLSSLQGQVAEDMNPALIFGLVSQLTAV